MICEFSVASPVGITTAQPCVGFVLCFFGLFIFLKVHMRNSVPYKRLQNHVKWLYLC